jgi:hypothetical protein
VTEHRVSTKTLILAGLLALGAGQGASASDAAYPTAPYQPRAFVFTAPNGPTVLRTEGCCQVIVPPGRPDLAVPPVPVAEVMNGGGFGYTGFDYFSDQITEGRFGARKRPKEYGSRPPTSSRRGTEPPQGARGTRNPPGRLRSARLSLRMGTRPW